jgi:hypothetical protein
MTTRIAPGGPPTYVAATPIAARTTDPPARPFQQLVSAGSAAVVQGAEQAATRLPGGPLLAAALRAPNSVPTFSAASPAGASSALPGAGGGLPVVGGAPGATGNSSSSVEGVLSQGADQNLYFLELQERISQENRTYSALSNVLKARHETVKNAISNIR